MQSALELLCVGEEAEKRKIYALLTFIFTLQSYEKHIRQVNVLHSSLNKREWNAIPAIWLMFRLFITYWPMTQAKLRHATVNDVLMKRFDGVSMAHDSHLTRKFDKYSPNVWTFLLCWLRRMSSKIFVLSGKCMRAQSSTSLDLIHIVHSSHAQKSKQIICTFNERVNSTLGLTLDEDRATFFVEDNFSFFTVIYNRQV